MKVSERNSADPGAKNNPFPAWVLRYASQDVPQTSARFADINSDRAEEQNLSELDHFEEAQPVEQSDAEPFNDETSLD